MPWAGSSMPASVTSGPSDKGIHKIKHVIIIVQENRSLNNLFYGFPGARTTSYGFDSSNNRIQLTPIGLETTWDLAHNSQGFFAACNGVGSIRGTLCRMNGFNREQVTCGHSGEPHCPTKDPQYGYVPHRETKPYFEMGRQYVLADEMFASNFDASSFVSHQYIIGGMANSTVNYPYTYWGCPGGKPDTIGTITPSRGFGKRVVVCFNNSTLGDELDAAHLTWAFYTSKISESTTGKGYKEGNGIWSAYQAIDHIYYGPDWNADVITPQTRFFADVAKGRLRAVSWITPTCQNSDHAGCGSNTGPSWVASLVNAVGKSQYWPSTAIFIFWDDYGGWYDPKKPSYVDYDGLGLRIPMLVISPYAKKGVVSHEHYEHGSILKFVEDAFGLARLAQSDRRANSPEHYCFDFSQPPRKFVRITAPHDQAYFMRQPLDERPPDSE